MNREELEATANELERNEARDELILKIHPRMPEPLSYYQLRDVLTAIQAAGWAVVNRNSISDELIDALDDFASKIMRGMVGGRNDFRYEFNKILDAASPAEKETG